MRSCARIDALSRSIDRATGQELAYDSACIARELRTIVFLLSQPRIDVIHLHLTIDHDKTTSMALQKRPLDGSPVHRTRRLLCVLLEVRCILSRKWDGRQRRKSVHQLEFQASTRRKNTSSVGGGHSAIPGDLQLFGSVDWPSSLTWHLRTYSYRKSFYHDGTVY